MEDLNSFGKIWLASSDLSGSFSYIEKCIKSGIDCIVLKTAMYNRDKTFSVKERYVNESTTGKKNRVVATAPNNFEFFSISQANSLHDNIKAKYPHLKVIFSFAPLKKEDFSLIPTLKGDAIEFNFRYFPLDCQRPYVVAISREEKSEFPLVKSLKKEYRFTNLDFTDNDALKLFESEHINYLAAKNIGRTRISLSYKNNSQIVKSLLF